MEKGLVKRDDFGKDPYLPAIVSKEKTQKHLLGRMINGLFGGSPTSWSSRPAAITRPVRKKLRRYSNDSIISKKKKTINMPSFAASPSLTRWVGFANSIWQLVYCGGVLCADCADKIPHAAARHNLAVYLLVAGAGWFVISLSWKYYSQPAGLSYTIATDSNSYYSVTSIPACG